MPNLQIKKTVDNGKNVIEVSGSIDENFNQHTKELPKEGQIEFSLKGLKSINSTGIREWIKLMQSMPKANLSFAFCPKIFIDQVNMVSGFLPNNGKIVSFYVPYYNEDNDNEVLLLYKSGENFTDKTVTIQETYKDAAGTEYELDVVKAKYFKFIQG